MRSLRAAASALIGARRARHARRARRLRVHRRRVLAELHAELHDRWRSRGPRAADEDESARGAGNPGYGVYHAPVRRLAETYLPGRTVDLTGTSFDDVLALHLGSGRPVWVVANAKFRELPASPFEVWKTTTSDVTITWEDHSVVIVGYDSRSVFINDPLDANGKSKRIERQAFRAAWEQLGSQAITYTP